MKNEFERHRALIRATARELCRTLSEAEKEEIFSLNDLYLHRVAGRNMLTKIRNEKKGW